MLFAIRTAMLTKLEFNVWIIIAVIELNGISATKWKSVQSWIWETQTKYSLAASWFQLLMMDSSTRLSDLKSMTKDYGVVFLIRLQDSYMIVSKGRKEKYNDEKPLHFVYVLIFSNCSFNYKRGEWCSGVQ